MATDGAAKAQKGEGAWEDGEDYLFPASLFATVALPLAIRRTLLAAV